MSTTVIDNNTPGSWFCEAAAFIIRGEIDASKHKDYMLPLVSIIRLSDGFENESKNQVKDF